MRIVNIVDPHCHLRGEEYPAVDFLGMALDDAKAVGLAGLIEMPNPKPWLTNSKTCAARANDVLLKQVNRHMDIRHGIHIGMTNDPQQVREALSLIAAGFPPVRGDKIFYTQSTGNMGVLDPEYQKWIWGYKATNGYKGVSIGHFEDETCYDQQNPFDPKKPVTHSLHQWSIAEQKSIETQLKNATDAGFRGTFYIAHLTSPAALEIVRWARKFVPFKIVVEVTWHHLLLNIWDYEKHGNRVKMNPPLRGDMCQKALWNSLLHDDAIDIIATDHAPHPVELKDSDKPPSGIPGILFWPKGIELLHKFGMDPERIAELTFHNANRVFNLRLEPREVDVEYNPELWTKYGWNPFDRIK